MERGNYPNETNRAPERSSAARQKGDGKWFSLTLTTSPPPCQANGVGRSSERREGGGRQEVGKHSSNLQPRREGTEINWSPQKPISFLVSSVLQMLNTLILPIPVWGTGTLFSRKVSSLASAFSSFVFKFRILSVYLFILRERFRE